MCLKNKVLAWIALAVVSLGCLGYVWWKGSRPVPRSNPIRQQYSYYRIMDQATGETLMVISSAPVTEGDELITGDNRRFVVVRVVGNQAYAKFVEKVKLTGRGAPPDDSAGSNP